MYFLVGPDRKRGFSFTNECQEKNQYAEKNKTHKKLILKKHSRITLSVARVTAFETNKGIGDRCGDTRKRGKTGGLLILLTP